MKRPPVIRYMTGDQMGQRGSDSVAEVTVEGGDVFRESYPRMTITRRDMKDLRDLFDEMLAEWPE